MRIVQLANLVTPTSGGIRTTLAALGRIYAAAGHERVEVVAGPDHAEVALDHGGVRRLIPGVPVPGGAGYRVLVDRSAVRATLAALAPDAIEVHDRFTLPWVLDWAVERGVPATLVVHERLAATIDTWARLGPVSAGPVASMVARTADRRLLAGVDHVVVASRYAAAGFPDDPRVHVVPFGVELDRFRPAPPGPERRGDDGPLRLVTTGRLSREKRAGAAVVAVADLVRRGFQVRLDVLGDGPLRGRLERAAIGLPVHFHGHVDADGVARHLADADIALALCPIETFGLAALEALASGTPVVVPRRGALPELLGHAAGVRPHGGVAGGGFTPADIVGALARRPAAGRSAAARRCAEGFPWSRLASHLLVRHGARPVPPPVVGQLPDRHLAAG